MYKKDLQNKVNELEKLNITYEWFFEYLKEDKKELQQRIDKAIEILKDTSVDMPSTLLIETIDYARHILGDKE